MKHRSISAIFLASALWPLSLSAQTDAVVPSSEKFIPDSLAQSDRVKVNGWDKFLKLGLTGNVSSNQNVAGKTDGQASTYGGKIEGALDLKELKQEWLNSFNLLLSYTKTPQIPRMVKGDDTLTIESLYKYYLLNSSGVFARANFDSAVARGYDEREGVTTYAIHKLNGDVETVTADRLRLTQGLRPARIGESIGAFTNIFDRSYLTMDLKAGVGLRQLIDAHQRIVNDNAATPEIDVNELRNVNKAGYEVGTDVGGDSEDKKFSYKVSFNALFPFYESQDDMGAGHSNFDKRVLDLTGKLSAHLTDWISLDYNYKMVRDPSVSTKAQIAQTYLLNLNHVFAERKAAPTPPPAPAAS